MKRIALLVALAAMTLSSTLFAQTGAETGTPFGHGQDSIACRKNISLLTTYVKSDNYQEAKDYWLQAYTNCPAATKNIYIYGIRILTWELSQLTDPAQRAAKLEEILSLYDDRAKYFGDDPKYGTDWILSAKISDYLDYVEKDKVDYNRIYEWTKKVVDEHGDTTDPKVTYFKVFSSLNKAIGNPSWHEQYVADYMQGHDILERAIEVAQEAQNQEQVDYVRQLKDQLDLLFAESGLADCKALGNIYGKNLEANSQNPAFLQAMLDMFRNANCEQDPLYFKASKYMFAIKPTAASALGLAKEALKNNRNTEATEYLNKAIDLTDDKKLKASCYTTLATIQLNARSYGQARTLAQKALAEDPSNGRPLILIAQMYAATASSIYPDDALKQRCVYFLVLDKLERARSIDPRVASEAARLISSYRRNLPKQSDIFMHPELESGKAFHVGGWIGETTTIR